MKKRLLAVLLCLCMAATFLPGAAGAAPADGAVTTYTELTTALQSNPNGITVRPATEFGWPTEETTVEFNSTSIILEGTWSIPQNITLKFNKYCMINGNMDTPPETSLIDLSGTLLVDKTAIIDGDTNTAGNTMEAYCDITIHSGAKLEIKMPEDSEAGNSHAEIIKGRTWTVEDGASLVVDHLGLKGTLTGSGTVTSEIEVGPSYIASDEATNAVLSGSLTLTNYVRINGYDLQQQTNTLTIPEDSTINFVADKEVISNGTGENYITYTKIVLNDYGRLNVNGTLNVKLNPDNGVDDGDLNGKDIVHFNRGNGCVVLGANSLLDVTYPCQVGWWRTDAVTVDGTGTVKFHHTAPAGDDWIKIPEGGSLDNKAQRDYLYRFGLANDISNRNSANPTGMPINIGQNVKIEYDWNCNGNHTWKTHRERAATCTENGYVQEICPGCMTTKDETYIPPLGHNISTTPGEDGKYHCQNEGCDVAVDTTPVKLPTPTGLTWHVQKIADSAETFQRPGSLSWTIPSDFTSTHDHMFEIKVYKKADEVTKAGDELVLTSTFYTRSGETDYTSFDFQDFLGSFGESGTYYFTVQMGSAGSRVDDSDPCYCTASDVATSTTWTYTRPSSTLAAPTELMWDGLTAKWTAITDTNNLECYLVNFYSGDNGNATSTETLRHYAGGFVDYLDDPSCTLDRVGEWLEGKYLYFTVQAASQDITQSNYSSIVLSPAYKYEGGTTPVDPDPDPTPVDPTPDTPSGGGGSSGGGSSSGGSTTTEATKNPDGSTTTKTEDKKTGTVTETTKNTDGSTTKVETKKDGTVTTTQTDATGNKTETVAKPDGSSVTTVAQKDGTAATVATDAEGKVEAEVTLPKQAVAAAQENEQPIMLPVPQVEAAASSEAAPVVTVKTGSSEPVKVLIPTTEAKPGTVAVIVKEDGTEEIVKTSVSTEDGLAVSLPDGATVKIVDNSKTFADVPASNWAADAVSFSSARELFSGTSEDSFSPDEPMTRAMMVTVLARFDGADTSGGSTWYEQGVEWAVSKGISDGSNPGSNISREQLAVMLWRYAGSPAPTGTLEGFDDAGSVSGYAQEAMRWAVENGILNGNGSGGLMPQGEATRAQVAQMLKNFISAQ